MEQRRKFRNLVASEGWAALREVAEAQAQIREGQVLRNATEVSTVGEHNFMKGEAAGIRALLALPSTIVESVESQLREQGEFDETA